MNSLPSERAAVLATIDPDNYSDGTQTSDWADMSKFETAMAIAMTGTIAGAATNGTVNFKLQQATSSGGAGAKDITGKAITALTEDGTDSDKQAIINVRGEELDVDGGFRYVAMVATLLDAGSPTEATYDFGAVLLGFDPRYGPASDNDLASVDEIVA